MAMAASTQPTADLTRFVDLAKQKTLDSRHVLFGNIAELFLRESGRLTDRERAQMTAILHDLISEVEWQVRRTLADRLKDSEEAPQELVLLLANDEIEIAKPILVESPALRDPDLIGIVRLRDREYRLAISLRKNLSAEVSDAIIATDDIDAIESLLRNADASLSAQAMEYLVAEAQRIDRLQRPLLQRRDLPADLAMRLYWWVSAALRQHILRAFPLDEFRVDEMLEEAAQTVAAADPGTPMAETARRMVDAMAEIHPLTPALLTQLLRTGRLPALVSAVSRVTGLSDALARRILLSDDHESIAVVCKACPFDRNQFAIFFLLLHGGGRKDASPTSLLPKVLAFYDEISEESAKRIIRFWARHPDYSKAIEDLTESR